MRIINFINLDNSEKKILTQAYFFLLIIRLMLWILPFSHIKKLKNNYIPILKESKKHQVSIEKLIWAIQIMNTYTPHATCLTRALAAQLLLSKYNFPSTVQIGVSKNKYKFEAHAWLEINNKIILGKSESKYSPILKLGGNNQ
jgi:hypothetical protein